MSANTIMRDDTSQDHASSRNDALQDAHRLHEKASAAGFDWSDISGVLAKVREEVKEIEDALDAQDVGHARRELGDLLFSAVNLARFLKADPSAELRRASARFAARFQALEAEAARRGIDMQTASLDELDVIWEEIKVKQIQEE